MEKDRKFRALAIAAICVAVVGVSVAYAALSTTLTISGTATVDTTASWNVRWEWQESTTDVLPAITKDSSIKIDSLTPTAASIQWTATFTAPNTTMTLTAYVKNEGTLNALLEEIDGGKYLTVSGAADSQFETSVTINGKTETEAANKILLSTSRIPVVVTVKLKDMGNDEFFALNGQSATFNLSLPFVQAEDGVTTPTL